MELENSGLLIDISEPYEVVAWQYVTPYKGCPNALQALQNALFYTSFQGLPRQDPSKNGRILASDAGWSSLAARRAHNPKVVGSNPAPATSNSVLSP